MEGKKAKYIKDFNIYGIERKCLTNVSEISVGKGERIVQKQYLEK